jgi:hypothetical protein
MGWALMAGFALLAGAGLFWFARRDKGALQFLGAALLLALAGYAWEGHPTMAGSPKAPPAHQQVREMRAAGEPSDHAFDQCGPADGESDHSLEHPFSREFAAARTGIAVQCRASRRQGLDNRGGAELGAAQGAVDPLARKRVEEVRGVADQQCAASLRHRSTRPARKWSRGDDAPLEVSCFKTAAHGREAVELLEEPRAASSFGEGNDQSDRRQTIADRTEPHVPGPPDVHLAQLRDVTSVAHVCRERDATRRSDVHATEPSRNDGPQTIRADDDACSIRFARPGSRIPRHHAGDGSAIVYQLFDFHALPDLGAGGFGCVAQNGVETSAR